MRQLLRGTGAATVAFAILAFLSVGVAEGTPYDDADSYWTAGPGGSASAQASRDGRISVQVAMGDGQSPTIGPLGGKPGTSYAAAYVVRKQSGLSPGRYAVRVTLQSVSGGEPQATATLPELYPHAGENAFIDAEMRAAFMECDAEGLCTGSARATTKRLTCNSRLDSCSGLSSVALEDEVVVPEDVAGYIKVEVELMGEATVTSVGFSATASGTLIVDEVAFTSIS